MSAWIVYSKDGKTERCRLKKLEYSGSFMNERTVTATFEYHSEVAFDVFDYIEYRGERFELEAIPSVKKTSGHNYEYELRFVSLKYELERCEMRDIVPNDNGVVYPTPITFSFTGNVNYLAERIQANLDALYGTGVWSIIVAEGVTSDEKNITISQQNCWNALSLVNTSYELDFTVKGRVVTIGGSKPLISHTFQYGKGNGLYEIERAADTNTGIVTKLRAYGSTRNLDYSYPKKPEWEDSVLGTDFALSPLRLMLPSFKIDGKTDYIMADDSLVAKYGIREASVIYEDIYPSITGATNSDGQAIDEVKAVEAVDDSKDSFVVYLHDLGFDLEDNLTTADAQISMKTGAMQGYTFNITEIEKQDDGSYKITLGRITTDTSDTGNYNIPNSSWNMSTGDKFVFLNILMPQEYIRNAEERLLERAKEYLNEYAKTNFSYNIGLHDKFLKENESVYDELIEGSKLSVYDEELGISEDVTIQSITITEDMEDNILPQVKVTLNNEPSASTLDRIQGQINELSETTSSTFSSQSELLQQYRRKLDKSFFDRLFVAVDTSGNELPSTDLTTPISYIKAKFSFASIGGVTMYAGNDVDIPSFVNGLPFDNTTIWLNPTTGVIEVIGGIDGGVADSVAWDNITGKPSWIGSTKPSYSYSEISGTPDLSVYAKLTDIPSLDGYATQSWVESKGYLTYISSAMVLDALGFTPYDTADFTKANIKSTLGISDWALSSTKPSYTTSEVAEGSNLYFTNARAVSALTDTLKAYVTLSGSQTITGEKNFTGGLKVNGSPIYYDATNGYWKLEGDLLVTGGVTMFANEGTYTPSTIMDAIVVDNVTIIKQDGKLVALGGGDGSGSVLDQVAWGNVLGVPSWITDTAPSVTISGISVQLGGSISQTDLQTALGLGSIAYKSSLSASDIPDLSWSKITSDKPTTLSGYGITDAVSSSTYTASDVLSKLLTVDGASSGLDADMLDGKHATSFLWNINGAYGKYNKVMTFTRQREKGFIMLAVCGSTNNYAGVGGVFRISWMYNTDSTADGVVNVACLNAYNGWETKLSVVRTAQYTFDVYWESGAGGIQSYQLLGKTSNVTVTSFSPTAVDELPTATYTSALTTMAAKVTQASSLTTARTIWGQSFNGTADVTGALYMPNATYLYMKDSSGTDVPIFCLASSDILSIGYNVASRGYDTYISGNNIRLRYGTSNSYGFVMNSSGNVTIGSSDLASTSYKLYVSGGAFANRYQCSGATGAARGIAVSWTDTFTDSASFERPWHGLSVLSDVQTHERMILASYFGMMFKANTYGNFIFNGGKVGINNTSPSYALDVNGSASATTMYINGIKLYKSQDGVLYLDGNLVVKGGVTMYGTDSTSAPSILDSLPVASTSAMGIAQFSSAHFTVTDGVVSIIGSNVGLNEAELASYLTSNTFVNSVSVSGSGNAVTSASISGNTLTLTKGTSYLPLSGGTTTGLVTIAPASYAKGLKIANTDYSGLATAIVFIGNSGDLVFRSTYASDSSTADLRYNKTTLKIGGYTAYHDGNLTKSTLGLGNVENTALSTWAGTSKITTLGTIATGTWNGSTIGVAYGGTGKTTLTSGYALIGNGTSAVALRAITNNTSATAVSASTNLITANTLYYHKGNSNITTVGTITSGTWNGSAIANAYLANSAITINGTSTSLGGSFSTASITAGTAGTSSATSGYTLAVPYVTMNKYGVVTAYGTHTHTISSIPNSSLANSAVTISGTSVSLGGSITQAALRTALGLGSNAYTSTAYLPLAGGTMTGNITLNHTYSSNSGIVQVNNRAASGLGTWAVKAMDFQNAAGTVIATFGTYGTDEAFTYMYLGGNAYSGNNLRIYSDKVTFGASTIWHSGNDGSGSGLDADLLDGIHASSFARTVHTSVVAYKYVKILRFSRTNDKGWLRLSVNACDSQITGASGEFIVYWGYMESTTDDRSVSIRCISSLGSTAEKVTAVRVDFNTFDLYWASSTYGQTGFTVTNYSRSCTIDEFSATAVEELPTATYTSSLATTVNINALTATKLSTARTIWGQTFDGTANVSGSMYLGNNANILWKSADGSADLANIYTNSANAFVLGKGSATAGVPTYLEGNVIYLRTSASRTCAMYINASQYVGIGNTSPSAALHVTGDILASGGMTMYSARKLKDIQDERGLSLEELSEIKPTRFTWKDNRDDRIHIGGIADDVMKVLPEVIYKVGDDDTLTMDYGNAAFAISASLIKPVINHEERIKMLEEENMRLKEEIEMLKWNIA